jgi:Nuclease-related domain
MAVGRRMITLRRGGRCAGCGSGLDAGTRAWWDPDERSTTCTACQAPEGPLSSILPAASLADRAVEPEPGTAGASAQGVYERRRSDREHRIRSAHPHLGGLILAFRDEPASMTAWAKGAEGERRVGARLDELAQDGVRVLHDRRVPRSRANLDHIAVAPSGIYVVDAKHYSGQVARRDVGGWFRRDVRLYVGRRECSRELAAACRQAELVRAALAAAAAAAGDAGMVPVVPVVPVLCFVAAEWGLFAKPFALGEVHITSRATIGRLVSRPGPLSPDAVSAVTATVAGLFPAYQSPPS